MKTKKVLTSFISLAASLLTLSNANAAFPGPYAGVIAGQGYTHYDAQDLNLSSAGTTNTGFSGGVFAGYQFNPNWGLELNFIQFTNTKLSNVNGVNNSTARIKENATEFLLKGTLPISDAGFNITARAGGAFSNPTSSGFPANATAPTKTRFVPAFGAGVSYDITPTIPVEISWTRVSGSGNLQNADLLGLSLSYFFG